MPRKNHPPSGTQTRLLKDGFWETTAVCVDAHHGKVVRKANKPGSTPGPWALKALREEIRYLAERPPGFPPLLCHWDISRPDGVQVGFEIPFYADHQSLADYHTAHRLDQTQADALQTTLAALLFQQIHQPSEAPTEPIGDHFREVFASTADQLGKETKFHELVHADNVRINGTTHPGLHRLINAPGLHPLCDRLDAQPVVRLHGDLILENILCHREQPLDHPLILIDPVSVTGISHGPALLDLIKYHSYASGQLLAVRSEWLQAGPVDQGYHCHIDPNQEPLKPWRDTDWTSTFWHAYQSHHGDVAPKLRALTEAYYALVMAVNTQGTQQWARLLLGIQALHHALGNHD